MEKLGLIAPLCQASHFPIFDWLSTSLKYLTQSANILSVTTQVDLSFQCGAAVGLSSFLLRGMACAFWLPALDGNGCGQPLYLLIGASRKCAGGSHEHCDCSRWTHAQSQPSTKNKRSTSTFCKRSTSTFCILLTVVLSGCIPIWLRRFRICLCWHIF